MSGGLKSCLGWLGMTDKLGCPVDEVLSCYSQCLRGWLAMVPGCHAFRGIPDGLRGPDHASGGIFHDNESLIPPVNEVGAFPNKDAP